MPKFICVCFVFNFQVEALVGRIERIRHSPLHVSISEGVDQWQSGIRELQNRRKEELGSSNSSRNRSNSVLKHQDTAGKHLSGKQ